ncbi:hypothetical protein ACIREM_00810 [Streptomyces shenzhenensis]|uniref:hypothetical protein n=1 Tax=Streptomyces shenzhenensis TaxID=943815 RepID=UPI0037F6C9CA
MPPTSEEPETSGTEALGDAGKRALAALRSEVKELKAKLKASESNDVDTRDAVSAGGSPSEGTRDAVGDESKTPRFQGTADGGARGKSPETARQLSRDDLSSMSPRAIETARRKGQLRDLLRGS